MRLNIFVVILLLQAFTSSGEQQFLSQSQEESTPMPLMLFELNPAQNNMSLYYTVGNTITTGSGWGPQYDCKEQDGPQGYVCGFSHSENKVGLICCDRYGDQIAFKGGRYAGENNCLSGYITEIGINMKESEKLQNLWFKCSDFDYLWSLNYKEPKGETLKAKQNGRYLYMCGAQFKTNPSGELIGLGAKFCS